MRFLAVSSSPPRLPRSVSRRDTSWPSDSSFFVSVSIFWSRVATSFLCCAFSVSLAACASASFCFC